MTISTITAIAASTSEIPYAPARLKFSYSSWTRSVAVSVLPWMLPGDDGDGAVLAEAARGRQRRRRR